MHCSRPIRAATWLFGAALLLLCLSLSPAGGAEIAAPDYVRAEPTPNEDGTHITVRWPEVEAGGEFDYVIYISQNRGWRWFQCRVMPRDGGYPTAPDIKGYYPYHFSPGNEHFAVLAPTRSMQVTVAGVQVPFMECVPWLARERRLAQLLKSALSNLKGCDQVLVSIENTLNQRRNLLPAYEKNIPEWERKLQQARKAYIARFGPPDDGQKLEPLALRKKLQSRLQEMKDEGDRGKDTNTKQTGAAELRRRLNTLEPAARVAKRLKAAREKKRGLKRKLQSLRDQFLQKAAAAVTDFELLRAEMQYTLSEYMEVPPEELDARRVRGTLPDIQKALQGEDLERMERDRLRYVRHVAGLYGGRKEIDFDREQLKASLAAQLARTLPTDLLPSPPAADEEEGGKPVAAADLREALRNRHEATHRLARDGGPEAAERWKSARSEYKQMQAAHLEQSRRRLRDLFQKRPAEADPEAYRRYITRLVPLSSATQERLQTVQRRQARRTYYFSLGARRPGKEPVRFAGMAHAAAHPNWIDMSNATNLTLAVMFAAAVVGMVLYARRNPDLYVRKIAGLDAIDEAIGRATEMGKPLLFVHGLKQVRDIATIASLNILSRLARQVAEYDSELLVTANDPITYSVSHEVVEEGYREAGRPDAFNPDNVFMVASRQFPYVAAVAGIMARHKPAANLFMGSFFAESLILAETGAETGAIQIAGTDSFSQLPFFVTTCDYTLMGEELYAASAYMSREPRLLGTIRAQDMGKSLLLAVIPTGTALSMGGINYLRVLFTAYTKAG